MKNILFTFFFISLAQVGLSQNESKIEGLKKLLPGLHDSARIDCLIELSEAYKGLPAWLLDVAPGKAQMDSAETLISAALEEAKKIRYNYGIAKALSLKAEISFDKYEDYPGTEKLCREAIDQYRSSPNKKGLHKAYWRLGTALYVLSSFDDAKNSFDTSYYLSREAEDSIYLLSSVEISCNNYLDKGDYANAFEKVLLFHQLIIAYSDQKLKSREFGMLGDLSFEIEDYNSAITYYKQGLAGNEVLVKSFALNNQLDSAKKYFNLYIPDTSDQRKLRFYLKFSAEYYSSLNNYQKALPNLLRSLYYNEQSKDVNQVKRLLIDVSQTHFALQNYDSAFVYAQDALAIAKQTGAKKVIRDASKIISAVYDHRHRIDSAYFYYKQYITINDFFVNNKVNGKLAAYGFKEKIKILNNEKKIQQVQLQKQALEKYILIAGIAVFLFIALLLWRNNRHKQKANILLHEQKEKVESTLTELKSTQSQLIQKEKMASLGELTAGIAHEIQNPLNFVNNFSEVNKEMLEELKAERLKPNAERDEDLQNNLINDVIGNEEKINHHGKRADSIVKGMLQHSQTSTGKKEPTNINALADEYLRLSYHGLRAKDNTFNATLKTDFDESVGNINIIPQDIGRVLLNLYNNAFYAVNERQKAESLKPKAESNAYEPEVTVTTRRLNSPSGDGGKILISVNDNGNGIPQKVVDKIFQPFFTTKPTGQGTGLGLSLSYDIVKANGGELKVETKEGEGSEFIISLPFV